MRLPTLTLLALLPVAALAQPPQQKRVEVITVQRRLALVIGNGSYHNLLRIPQSLNDADDMAAALRALGFTVTEYKDLQIEPLIRAVTSFRATIQPSDLALVYYSGHGGQWGEENYLLPVEYEPPAPQEAEFVGRRALPMSMIRDGLERNARVRVLIFDACRSSPLLSSKDTPGGLTKIPIRPEGTLVAYASADQQGSGFHTDRRNSDYTEQLLKSLRSPQLPDIKSVFEQVQIQVYEASNKSQTPYIYGFLSGPLYLGNPPAPVEVAVRQAPSDTIDLDLERYTAVKESRDPDQLESVANKLHRSDLAEILRERAKAMRSVAAPPPAAVVNNTAPAPNLDVLTKHAGDAFDRQDYPTAFPDYVKLALSGDALAMARLAYMYDVGQGTTQNYGQAFNWYSKAAQAGNSYAMFNLGVMYDNAKGVTQDYNQAFTWYRKGADAGNANAMTNLAFLYETGHGVTLDYNQAVSWYRKAADGGNIQAMNNLGTLYELGHGVPKDIDQAKVWYRKASDAGNADAKTNLARLGNAPSPPAPKTGLTDAEKAQITKRADAAYDRKDYAAAVPEYRKLALVNDTWAMSRLGYLYNRGLGVKRDDAEAARWLRKASEAGNVHSMYNLAVLYGSGQGVAQDYDEAVKWYRKAAEGGDVDGMAGLAYMYDEGHGVPQDFDQAMTWYRKAADLNNAWAMNNIGTLYQNGQGVPKDLDQAAVWYRKAIAAGNEDAKGNLSRLPASNNSSVSNNTLTTAEKEQITKRADDAYDRKDYAAAVPEYRKLALAGDLWGMSRLGYLYDRGLGIRQDDAQSAYWLRKAAEAGNAHSMYNLAVLYGSGKGVPQDNNQAVAWYRKAADAGDVDGMAGLAFMYSNGRGLPQDYSQALSWYRKAADQGNDWAMNNLATLYENGEGVSKDIEQAVVWYRKAAAAGNEDAKGNLKRLGR
jgi:TPR repeat protein